MNPQTLGSAVVVGPDDGETIWFGPNRTTIKATGADTAGSYGLVHSWIPAGAGPPLHVHYGVDEAFWILEGEVRILCGDEEVLVGPGSFVLLPRDIPHTFAAGKDRDVRMLTLLSPGGSERFFADAGVPAAGAGLPPAGPPDIPALSRAAVANGMAVLGPGLG